jgi:hypothetical protein
MKSMLRIPMVLASLALLLWGGVAMPAEPPTVPESPEYLMGVVEAYPDWGVGDVVASDQMEATTARAYGGSSEEDGEWVVPGEPMVAEVILPEPGTYEYSLAMETGSLPSTCGDKPCAAEEFTIIESGGIPYRLEVDFGGN